MAKNAESNMKDSKKAVITSVRKIMDILQKQKISVDEKEKYLNRFEKELEQREKRLEDEMNTFSLEVQGMVASNEKLYSSSKK